jgi:ABC-type uncharacterized transport system permease subunit
MDPRLIGALAIISYAAAACGFATAKRSIGLACTAVAVFGHAAFLYPSTVTLAGVNISLLNAASVVACCVSALVLMVNLRQSLASLAVAILPLAALALALDLWFPTQRMMAKHLPFGVQLHVASAIIAYSLFAIAAIQAMLLAFAARQLRQHHPVLNFLPPLPTMEAVMFQLTALAFGVLTASLILGSAYIENIRAQHLGHKIVFSMLAWMVFAALVFGRWRWGWRGRRGVKYVLSGFALLALAFFGTKFVLEIVLHRV